MSQLEHRFRPIQGFRFHRSQWMELLVEDQPSSRYAGW